MFCSYYSLDNGGHHGDNAGRPEGNGPQNRARLSPHDGDDDSDVAEDSKGSIIIQNSDKL